MRLAKFLGISTMLGMGLASPATARAEHPSEPKRRKRAFTGARKRALFSGWPAGLNRRTGKRHTHAREIARRTTKAGSPERAAAYAALKR